MRVLLHSTTRVVSVVAKEGGDPIPARVWEGVTERGVPVVAFITRIAPDVEDPGPEVTAPFEADLYETEAPRAALTHALPMRLVL